MVENRDRKRGPALTAVFFDLGDTLVYCRRSWPALLEQAMALCHERLAREGLSCAALLRVARRVGGQAAQTGAQHRAFPAPERVAAVLHELGIAARPALVQELVELLYAPVSRCSRVATRAREVLRDLKQAGLRLGLISNTPYDVPGALVERDLVRFGLREYFDSLTFSDAGFRKPHPQIFRRALAALETKPGRALMVGDSLAEDIAGAQALGMRTIWMGGARSRRGQAQREVAPDWVARDLPQVRRIVLRLAAGGERGAGQR